MPRDDLVAAEQIARRFHDTYEHLAPYHGYETRESSRRPWADVPKANRELMIATVAQLLREGVITDGSRRVGW